MPGVAIVGAGDLGAAIAHAIAHRGRVRALTLVDDAASVAVGKALDLQQAAPIDGIDIEVTGSGELLSAAGASVVVVADAVGGGEWADDRGLALIERLVRAGTTAPFVFPGPRQTSLMAKVAGELGVPTDRLIGTAGAALVGTTRALVGLETGGSGIDVSVTIGGCPPRAVIAWASATIDGVLVTDRIPPHRLRAINQAVLGFWPPAPRAIAAPTAQIVESLLREARDVHQAAIVLDGQFGRRGVVGLLPVRLGAGRIRERLLPSLTPQEAVAVTNSLEGA
jgi:malate dehydrogenase